MPGRSMAGRESLKLAMSVRFAPRQPDLRCIEGRGVVKAERPIAVRGLRTSSKSLLV